MSIVRVKCKVDKTNEIGDGYKMSCTGNASGRVVDAMRKSDRIRCSSEVGTSETGLAISIGV